MNYIFHYQARFGLWRFPYELFVFAMRASKLIPVLLLLAQVPQPSTPCDFVFQLHFTPPNFIFCDYPDPPTAEPHLLTILGGNLLWRWPPEPSYANVWISGERIRCNLAPFNNLDQSKEQRCFLVLHAMVPPHTWWSCGT